MLGVKYYRGKNEIMSDEKVRCASGVKGRGTAVLQGIRSALRRRHLRESSGSGQAKPLPSSANQLFTRRDGRWQQERPSEGGLKLLESGAAGTGPGRRGRTEAADTGERPQRPAWPLLLQGRSPQEGRDSSSHHSAQTAANKKVVPTWAAARSVLLEPIEFADGLIIDIRKRDVA